MLLAGRVAASYGRDNNLAFAYRYQLRPDSDRDAEGILSMRTNLPTAGSTVVSPEGLIGHGLIRYHDILTRGLSLSASGYSARPASILSLGIGSDTPHPFGPPPSLRDALSTSGYVRATSPLRRYPDMLFTGRSSTTSSTNSHASGRTRSNASSHNSSGRRAARNS